MYVCHCFGVTDTEVREAIADGAHTVEDLAAETNATTGCGGCRETLLGMLSADASPAASAVRHTPESALAEARARHLRVLA